MTITAADPSWTNVSYCGPAVLAVGADHPLLRFSLFRHAAGAALRGLVICANYAGLRFTSLPRSINSASANTAEQFCSQLVAAGWDVLVFSVPVARSDDAAQQAADNMQPTSDTSFLIDVSWTQGDFPISQTGIASPRYGPAYFGNGMIVVASDAGFTIPSGLKGYDGAAATVHPMRDPRRLNGYMATTMLAQYVLRTLRPLFYAGLPIGCFGGSASADVGAWIAFGPDRGAYHFPGGVGQDAVSTLGAFSFFMATGFQTYPPVADGTWMLPSIAKSIANGGSDKLDQESDLPSQGTVGTIGKWGCLDYIDDTAAILGLARTLPVHLTSGEYLAIQHAPYTTANTQNKASTHNGWFMNALMLSLLPGGNVTMIVDATPDATNVSDMAAAGLAYTVLALEADRQANRLAWLTAIADNFTSPVHVLAAGDFPGGSAYASVAQNAGPLTAVKITNLTDARLAVTFDGVHDHDLIEVNATRSWDRRRGPIASGTVGVRGYTGDPTTGSASVMVARK